MKLLFPLFILSSFPILGLGQKAYESAPINYYESEAVDPVAAFFADPENVRAWEKSGRSSFLTDFMEAFDIPPSSQSLVFSKTSLQASRIRPRNPRAVYFNDEIYVAWVPGGDLLEVSVPSPETGTNFYTIEMDGSRPELIRETHDCLQCHGGSFTRDVPGHLVRSVYPDLSGQPIFKAGTRLMDSSTPIHERWGGWLVTGTDMPHRGNRIYSETHSEAEAHSAFTIDDVPKNGYLSNGSDVVAQLILAHQAKLHTLIADLTLSTRRAFHDQKVMDELLKRDEPISESTARRIKNASDKVLQEMFFVNAAEIQKIDQRQSPFAESFSRRGPKDSKGRSLFKLRLNRRIFRYPFSYIVYTDTFNNLPPAALDYLWAEIERILDPLNRYDGYEHLSRRDKVTIKEILLETHPAARNYWK